MEFHIMTLFPEMVDQILSESIIGRARKAGKVSVTCWNIRDYANNRSRHVDDYIYGGGPGMLMQVDPIYGCYKGILKDLEERGIQEEPRVIYMSPKGKTLTQNKLKELSAYPNICILCGHYEGVDQRVLDRYVDEEISIGDYVLTGGELPALVLADSLARLQKGVLSDDECFELESHYDGLLEYPQYTKPQNWRGEDIPEVLFSGHHANIEKWRREQSVIETAKKRPDMIRTARLSEKERKLADGILFGDNAQKKEDLPE